MSGSKRWYIPTAAAFLLLAGAPGVLAGSQTSLLDPYQYIQAPQKKDKQAKKDPASAAAPAEEQPTTTATYVTMPAPEGEGKGVAGKAGGIISGVNAKFKAAGSGIIDGTKHAGAKITTVFGGSGKQMGDGLSNGTKKVGSTIANGAKASGGYFMKGARVIGHGLKSTGEKMKEGTSAVGSKVAGLPGAFHHKEKSLVATQQNQNGAAHSDETKSLAAKQTGIAIPAAKTEELSTPLGASAQNSHSETQANSHPAQPSGGSGFFAKTLGHIKMPFGHSNDGTTNTNDADSRRNATASSSNTVH